MANPKIPLLKKVMWGLKTNPDEDVAAVFAKYRIQVPNDLSAGFLTDEELNNLYNEVKKAQEWIDPAGGTHSGDEIDGAAMYESKKIKQILILLEESVLKEEAVSMDDLKSLSMQRNLKASYYKTLYRTFREIRALQMNFNGWTNGSKYQKMLGQIRDAIMKEFGITESQLKEGTWSAPNSPEKMQLSNQAMQELIAWKDKYYNVVGDDEAFDGIDNTITRIKELQILFGK